MTAAYAVGERVITDRDREAIVTRVVRQPHVVHYYVDGGTRAYRESQLRPVQVERPIKELGRRDYARLARGGKS